MVVQDKDNRQYLPKVTIQYIATKYIEGKKESKVKRLLQQKGKTVTTNKQGKTAITLLLEDYVLFVSKPKYESTTVRIYEKDKRLSMIISLLKEERCIQLAGTVLYEENKQAIYQAEVNIRNLTSSSNTLIYTNPKGVFESCLDCNSTYEIDIYDAYFGRLKDTIIAASYCQQQQELALNFMLKTKMKARKKIPSIVPEQKITVFSDPFSSVANSSLSSNGKADSEHKHKSIHYQVIAGTFAIKKNAEQRLEKVKNLGFENASIKSNQSASLYMVCLGAFSNQEMAVALKNKMVQRYQIKAYVGRF